MNNIEERAKTLGLLLSDSIELINKSSRNDYVYEIIKSNRENVLLLNTKTIKENEKFFWETNNENIYLKYDSEYSASGNHINIYIKNNTTSFSYTNKFYLFSKIFKKDEKNILSLLDEAIKESQYMLNMIKIIKNMEAHTEDKCLKNAVSLSQFLTRDEMLSVLPEVSIKNKGIFAEVFFKAIPDKINLNDEVENTIKTNWLKVLNNINKKEVETSGNLFNTFNANTHQDRLKYLDKIIEQMINDNKVQNILEKTNLYKQLNHDFNSSGSNKSVIKRKI